MPDIVEYTPSSGTTLVKGGSSSRRISGTLFATDLDSASGLVVGSGAVLSDRVRLPVQSGSNPGTPTGGDFWFRGDTGKLNYYDGSQVQELGTASGAWVPNPVTKASGDLLQYDGSAWDARGIVSGDPLIGAIYAQSGYFDAGKRVLNDTTGISNPTRNSGDILQYNGSEWVARGGGVSDRLAGTRITGNLNLNGQLLLDGASSQHILWSNDGAGTIGAAGSQRPSTIYAQTSVVIAGQTAMKGGDATGGDLTGTYPSTLTVAKVQGYLMNSGAPSKGESWQFDGSNWSHSRLRYRVLAAAYGAWNDSNLNNLCSYSAAANEFSNQTMILGIVVVKNGSNPTLETSLWCPYGGSPPTKLYGVGGWTYSHNKVMMYAWVGPDDTTRCQYYYDHYGGIGTTDMSVGGTWISLSGTWYLRIQRSGAGTYQARGWLIAISGD